MSITVTFPPSNMSTKQYDEVLRRLEAAGAGAPPGREYHTCYGAHDNLSVVDVWTSLAEFEAFGSTLMPILAELGIEVAEPQISETYNVIA